jgi:hypothetical protein
VERPANKPWGTWGLPARIRRSQDSRVWYAFLQVSRHLPVVGKVDEKLLSIADTIPQFQAFGRALRRRHGLSMGAVPEPQIGVGHREFGSMSHSAR